MSKERLVELIGNAPIGVNGITLLDKHEPKVIEEVADYLLASDEVIVPPCKVGDKIYKPWKAGGKNAVAEFVVIAITSAIRDDWCIKYKKIGGTICYQANITDVGKTVFLAREKAVAKLKESESK